MGKVNYKKTEVLEVKYFQDQSFENGVRKNSFVKTISKNTFAYGVVHFTNGLKLLLNNNSLSKIKIKNIRLSSTKRYMVTYSMSWEGSTKFHNGEIVRIMEEDCVEPSILLSNYLKAELPSGVEEIVNREFEFYGKDNIEQQIENKRNILLGFNSKTYLHLEPTLWLARNVYNMDEKSNIVIKLKIVDYVEKFSKGYDGIKIETLIKDFESDCMLKDNIQSCIEDLLKEGYIFCYNKEKECLFPYHYTD